MSDSRQRLTDIQDSLQHLLEDESVPQAVRAALKPEYEELQAMLDKLEHGHIHIAVFGRVSVGKSSLLNALMGEQRFAVSPLHGATLKSEYSGPVEAHDGQVYFIDTPGIDEIGGEDREAEALEIAQRSDLLLFVVEGDLAASERAALAGLLAAGRPLLLVLNKADRYTPEEQQALRERLAEHAEGLVSRSYIVLARANPAERTTVVTDKDGNESERREQPAPDVAALKTRLWEILEREGKELAALNAGLFAGRVSDAAAKRITAVKEKVANEIVQRYCLAKGVAVALNPIPITDLIAAAALDGTMVYHLSRVYGLPLTKSEAGELVKVITLQIAALMSLVWITHLIASAAKSVTAGFSTAFTALTQGGVAWYATRIVGEAARRYLENGASWGEAGPKRAVKAILDDIDRDSVMAEARERLKAVMRA